MTIAPSPPGAVRPGRSILPDSGRRIDYLAIALDYVEDGAWNDPEYLESLMRDAERVTLPEAGAPTVALKLVVPKQ